VDKYCKGFGFELNLQARAMSRAKQNSAERVRTNKTGDVMSKQRNIQVRGHEDPSRAPSFNIPEGVALPNELLEVKEVALEPVAEPEVVEQDVPAVEQEELQSQALEEVEAEEPKEEAEQQVDDDSEDNAALPSDVQALIQKRIDKLTRQKKEAQEREQVLRQEFDALRASSAPVLPQIPQVYGDDWYMDPMSRQRVDMPKADDYANNTPKYFEDMRRFTLEKEKLQGAVKHHQLKLYADQQAQAEYNKRAQAAIKERYPDFVKVVDTPLMSAVFDHSHVEARDIIRDSEKGPDIAYYLGKNPDILSAMQNMTRAQVLREIGRLEGLMESTLKPKTVSKAPAPVKSAGNLSGASAKGSTKSNDPMVSYRELREKLKARR
jgi:hypothetical protein